jgi:uncharacterized protein YxjI
VNITIQQRRFTLRSEYDISALGCRYYARKKLFSFNDRVQLLAEDGRVLARLKKRWTLFRPSYDFEFSDGRCYRFRCEKLWKGVFLCEGNGEPFRLYRHKRRNYSIFQNERQIAAFTKNFVKIGKGDRYDIRVNRDADALMVICLALTVDTENSEDDGAAITFDLGNIGPEDRPIDASWEPS